MLDVRIADLGQPTDSPDFAPYAGASTTANRFRIKFDPEPRSLWRDVVLGGGRTIGEFHTTINESVGLDHGHLWFVGVDQDY